MYQNSGFTPAWSVSEWWLARTGCRDRQSAYTPPVTGGRTQPPHPARP